MRFEARNFIVRYRHPVKGLKVSHHTVWTVFKEGHYASQACRHATDVGEKQSRHRIRAEIYGELLDFTLREPRRIWKVT